MNTHVRIFHNAVSTLAKLKEHSRAASLKGNVELSSKACEQAFVLFNDILSVVDDVAPFVPNMQECVEVISELMHSIDQSVAVAMATQLMYRKQAEEAGILLVLTASDHLPAVWA